MTTTVIKQQPRGGRQRRHTKSDVVSLPQKNIAPQPRHLPHHHVAHQLQNPPSRGRSDETTPPHTPRSTDLSQSKKKRRQRKQKDTVQSPPSHAEQRPSNDGVPLPRSPITASARAGAVTPPSPSATPGRVYAGPTFHHSPAPSSLPVPKFFSKSVPAPSAPSLQAMLELESTDGSQSSSPPRDNETHLERLFRADREEKAWKKHQSEEGSDNESSTDTSSRDMFFGMEPDSPFQARFKSPQGPSQPLAGRSVTESDFSTEEIVPLSSHRFDGDKQDVQSAALRQFLFQSPFSGTVPVSPPSISPSPASRVSRFPPGSPLNVRHSNGYSTGSPVPQRRLQCIPKDSELATPPPKAPQFRGHQFSQSRQSSFHDSPTPTRQPTRILFQQSRPAAPTACQNISDMENSLRRILKLDSHDTSGGGVLI